MLAPHLTWYMILGCEDYGKLLVEIVSIVPDGTVCFIASYSCMGGIIAICDTVDNVFHCDQY